jgi:hypothetical protein
MYLPSGPNVNFKPWLRIKGRSCWIVPSDWIRSCLEPLLALNLKGNFSLLIISIKLHNTKPSFKSSIRSFTFSFRSSNKF